jgi:glycosyltransferase involved in cell wall biosynthesis
MVSIVIPCYNAGRFISKTIESALEQTFQSFEIIVVDDGSTDDSRKIIESFGRRVRAEFGPNRGASAARNKGTELARGSYLQYLDADDLLLPNALIQRVEAMERTGADVAYSDWQRLVEDETGRFNPGEIVSRTIESVHTDIEIATFTDFWCPPAALLYRRAIVEKIGGWNESLPVIQDARFLLDAALHGARFAHVPAVEAQYRVHRGQSLSRRNPHAFKRDCFENALQVEQWWRGHGNLNEARRQAVVKVLSGVARGSFDGDSELFRRAYAELLRIEPGWKPAAPWALRCLSHLLGYPRAEAVAMFYRSFKKHLSLANLF